MKVDKYNQLVNDLSKGDLNIKHLCNALREHVRCNSEIPESIKDLISGRVDDAGIIFRAFSTMQDIIGKLELAYRRGAG